MHVYSFSFKFKPTGFSVWKPGYAMSSSTRYTPAMLESFGRDPNELRQWEITEISKPIHISHEYKWVATKASKFFESSIFKKFPPVSVHGGLYKALGVEFNDVVPFSGMKELIDLRQYGYTDNWIEELNKDFWPKFTDWVNSQKHKRMNYILESRDNEESV